MELPFRSRSAAWGRLKMGLFSFVTTFLLAATSTPLGAQSQDETLDTSFAPIFIHPDYPSYFLLSGDIDGRTAFNFKRAVSKYGKPRTLGLRSNGGLVHEGLLLALEIEELGLSTEVVDYCLSACFYIFMAGNSRQIAGDLGVHQISSPDSDLRTGQVAIADMIDVLNQLGVDSRIYPLIFQTPSESMYVFSETEIAAYGLATSGTNVSQGQVLSPVRASSQDLLGGAIAFVSSYNRLWSLPNSEALSQISQMYSEAIDFYGNRLTKAEVMNDKIAFAARWPVRDYFFNEDQTQSTCDKSGHCTIVGKVGWQTFSPDRNARSQGTAEVEMNLQFRDGRFYITKEDGRVIARR